MPNQITSSINTCLFNNHPTVSKSFSLLKYIWASMLFAHQAALHCSKAKDLKSDCFVMGKNDVFCKLPHQLVEPKTHHFDVALAMFKVSFDLLFMHIIIWSLPSMFVRCCTYDWLTIILSSDQIKSLLLFLPQSWVLMNELHIKPTSTWLYVFLQYKVLTSIAVMWITCDKKNVFLFVVLIIWVPCQPRQNSCSTNFSLLFISSSSLPPSTHMSPTCGGYLH